MTSPPRAARPLARRAAGRASGRGGGWGARAGPRARARAAMPSPDPPAATSTGRHIRGIIEVRAQHEQHRRQGDRGLRPLGFILAVAEPRCAIDFPAAGSQSGWRYSSHRWDGQLRQQPDRPEFGIGRGPRPVPAAQRRRDVRAMGPPSGIGVAVLGGHGGTGRGGRQGDFVTRPVTRRPFCAGFVCSFFCLID